MESFRQQIAAFAANYPWFDANLVEILASNLSKSGWAEVIHTRGDITHLKFWWRGNTDTTVYCDASVWKAPEHVGGVPHQLRL